MRTVTSAFETASVSEHVEACHLVELDLASGVTYVTDAGHDVVWNGNTYIGVGALAGIESVRETSTGEVVSVRLSLSGAISSFVNLALQENTQNRECRIRVALWQNGSIISDPSLEFVGRLNAPVITDEPSEDGDIVTTVSVTVENKFIGSRRPKTLRHSQQDHMLTYPTDTIHRFMPKLQDANIVWPAASFFRR
jgi:hypothetical protein